MNPTARGIRKLRSIEENYQCTIDDWHSFDIRFWQSQGDRAIFETALEMLHDYLLIRGEDVDEFRLQRSVEPFRKDTARYLIVGTYIVTQ